VTPAVIAAVSASVTICILALVGRWKKNRRRVTITDYQRGVHFIGGRVAKVLPPGNYRFKAAKETILPVDLRPQPIVIERLLYRDGLNRPAVISIATELLVWDPEVAVTRLKDPAGDAYNMVVGALREFVSHRAPGAGSAARAVAAQELTAALNAELGKIGMKVNPVEITEAWAAPFSRVGGDCSPWLGGS
jgi:regulator of protease activity HflC (stomatin/prohibitin superfamily)